MKTLCVAERYNARCHPVAGSKCWLFEQEVFPKLSHSWDAWEHLKGNHIKKYIWWTSLLWSIFGMVLRVAIARLFIIYLTSRWPVAHFKDDVLAAPGVTVFSSICLKCTFMEWNWKPCNEHRTTYGCGPGRSRSDFQGIPSKTRVKPQRNLLKPRSRYEWLSCVARNLGRITAWSERLRDDCAVDSTVC